MNISSLGNTKLKVSRIGLGLAALGRPGYINVGHAEDLNGNYEINAMETAAHDVLDAAYEAGVIYFDAARSYGRSELFLESWLASRNIPPEAVTVGSKWGYRYTADWCVDAEAHEVKEHTVDHLKSQWQESNSILGDQLNLYQIHSATIESGVLENVDVLNELATIKSGGTAIGFSTTGPHQAEVIDKALDIYIDGTRLFDSVQATWNILERSAGPALARAHAAGLGVIVKEGLANGRLTNRAIRLKGDHTHAVLTTESHRLGTSLESLALSAILAQPWVDTVLSGAARTDHFRSNLNALGITYDNETDEKLSTLLEVPVAYWAERSALAWN